MTEKHFPYVIVGGGLAAAGAVSGIRELDRSNPVLCVGAEQHPPYHRPPLTKGLWTGKKTLDRIPVHDSRFYEDNGIRMETGTRITALDPVFKTITTATGRTYSFDKLLLATGATPRALPVPGALNSGIHYYRYLDDFLSLREQLSPGARCLIVGGGFIGSELAPSLVRNGISVTMLFPEPHLCHRVLPHSLGQHLTHAFRSRGVEILAEDTPSGFAVEGTKYITMTARGRKLFSDAVVVGAGVSPAIEPAASARLDTADGIRADAYLRTSHPDIFTAGDNTRFPCEALHSIVRLEHWDNAMNQGLCAGRNMAGADRKYTHLPSFFSDMFDFSYEAVGSIDARLETYADWHIENDTGTVYYLDRGKVKGILLCNMPDRIDRAREVVALGESLSPAGVRGAV